MQIEEFKVWGTNKGFINPVIEPVMKSIVSKKSTGQDLIYPTKLRRTKGNYHTFVTPTGNIFRVETSPKDTIVKVELVTIASEELMPY